jgi:hypothetical protein
MKLDNAKSAILNAAEDSLKTTFSNYVKQSASGDRKAAEEFETGAKLVITTEQKALDIIEKIFKETS